HKSNGSPSVCVCLSSWVFLPSCFSLDSSTLSIGPRLFSSAFPRKKRVTFLCTPFGGWQRFSFIYIYVHIFSFLFISFFCRWEFPRWTQTYRRSEC
ncbi:hypothetical protein PVBG_05352, partial [Plasmodium vivax Brazil I]